MPLRVPKGRGDADSSTLDQVSRDDDDMHAPMEGDSDYDSELDGSMDSWETVGEDGGGGGGGGGGTGPAPSDDIGFQWAQMQNMTHEHEWLSAHQRASAAAAVAAGQPQLHATRAESGAVVKETLAHMQVRPHPTLSNMFAAKRKLVHVSRSESVSSQLF
jgi:hypothetical protein